MNGIIKFIEEKMVPPLMKFSRLRYLQILQKTFVSTMSLLLIGSLFLLVAEFPVDAWKEFLGPDKIALIKKASGVGTQVFAIYVAIATAYYAIMYYNDRDGETKKLDPMPIVLLTASAFLLLFPIEAMETGSFINVGFLGAKSAFTAILVAAGTVEIFRFVVKRNLVIKMPEGVPPMIVQAFIALIPSTVVILFWWSVRWLFNIDLPSIILQMFTPLVSVSDSLFGVILIPFLNRGLWFVGIHGGNVVGSIADPILRSMDATNLTAAQAGEALPHIATFTFFDQYIWIGLVPLAVALILCKSKHLKAIGWLALPAALFNIGEPLNFGVPVVLNPLLMIPSILAFVVIAIIAYGLTVVGMIPIPYIGIPWTVPAPIKAFLGANGSFTALLWVLAAWVIMFMIFYPFVKALDKNHKKEEEKEKIGQETVKSV
ncbi:MAG: PTS sugar transporter subunit IIC [Clostridium sp.]|uniref:PTS sugar transporter subunit IIC n=1 Tax=Clostridium sp. TaxID=1506 RepID=UPI003F401E30